jgi:hypothetical protein
MSAKGDASKQIAWEELKREGSEHYRTPGTQPIDLYKDMGILRQFAVASIVKYAVRNADTLKPVSVKDMKKIRHYTKILETAYGDIPDQE